MAHLDTIIREIDALPRSDQRRLLEHLHESVFLSASTSPVPMQVARARFAVIDKALSDIVGVYTITAPCRHHIVAWARHICAFQMRTEGYTTIEIARCMKRSHATVIWSYQRVEEMLERPSEFTEEMLLLRRLREAIGGPAL